MQQDIDGIFDWVGCYICLEVKEDKQYLTCLKPKSSQPTSGESVCTNILVRCYQATYPGTILTTYVLKLGNSLALSVANIQMCISILCPNMEYTSQFWNKIGEVNLIECVQRLPQTHSSNSQPFICPFAPIFIHLYLILFVLRTCWYLL